MFIPPSTLESSGHEYQSEPFVSNDETTEVIESDVSGGAGGLIWPIKKFDAKLESWGGIIVGLITSLLCLWYVASLVQSSNVVEVRRGLFLAPIFLCYLFYSIRHCFEETLLTGGAA